MRYFEPKKWEYDNDKIQLTIPENPMESVDSIFLIQNKINFEINQIVEEFSKEIPLNTSIIQLVINPNDNVDYYSFNGIQYILNRLFRYKNHFIENEILNIDSYLKIYLIKNDFFTIPSIKIEIILFKKLEEKSQEVVYDFLENELLRLIGNTGSFYTYEINHPLKLQHILKIPLLLGYPQFKKEGIYEKLGFSKYQLNELNYLFTNTIIKLDNEEIMEDVFGELRLVMFSESMDREKDERIKKLLIDLSLRGDSNIDFEGDLDNIRYIISQNNEEDTGLPF
jgi:hypothetical protein